MSSSRVAVASAAAVVASACNEFFELQSTAAQPPIDAQYFDMPLDASFMCPPIGTTPRFSQLLHQPIFQTCTDYTVDINGRAIAYCNKDFYGIAEGTLDMPMTPATGFVFGDVPLSFPRLTPEGDDVFVSRQSDRSTPGEIHVFHRQGAMWSHTYQLQAPFTLSAGARIGTPTFGPVRRLMMIDLDTLYELDVDGAGNATVHDQYTTADLGATFVSSAPNLSPDGLRMTIAGIATDDQVSRTLYTDRASTSARFRTVDAIDAFAFAHDPFMTADCARIYFSAAASVLYVQQE